MWSNEYNTNLKQQLPLSEFKKRNEQKINKIANFIIATALENNFISTETENTNVEFLVTQAVTEKFGRNILEGFVNLQELDLRSIIEVKDEIKKSKDIQEKFYQCYDATYDLEKLNSYEVKRIQSLIEKAQLGENVQLQFCSPKGEWKKWTSNNFVRKNTEWRLGIHFEPFSSKEVILVETLIAEIEFPLYKENEIIEISFAPIEGVTRKKYSGAFKRIGAYKLSIGTSILGLNELPIYLRARFDATLNEQSRQDMVLKHLIATKHRLALEDMIKVNTSVP